MRSFVLATKEFPERHTAIEIAQKLKEITTDFKVQDKVVCVVHDRACARGRPGGGRGGSC